MKWAIYAIAMQQITSNYHRVPFTIAAPITGQHAAMSHRETPRLGGLASQRAFSMASTVSWVDLGIPRETGNLAEKPGKSD